MVLIHDPAYPVIVFIDIFGFLEGSHIGLLPNTELGEVLYFMKIPQWILIPGEYILIRLLQLTTLASSSNRVLIV